MRNGSITNIAGKDTIISNTCAFDSVSQTLAVGVVDDYKFSRTLRDTDDDYFNFIKMIAANDNITDIYKHRSDILKTFFDTNIDDSGKTFVTCECKVAYIFERILINRNIYSADIQESCTNLDCSINNVKRICAFLPLDFNKKTLSESAESTLTTENNMSTCRKFGCSGTKTIDYNLKDVIAFEPESDKIIVPTDLPKTMMLKGIEYKILSVIEFVPPPSSNCIGHYKSHCLRGTKWECFDDLSTRITKSNKSFYAHSIIYTRND